MNAWSADERGIVSGYDVFLSFGGHDRAAVRRLAQALTAGGLRVFTDERIGIGNGITRTIEDALASSATFLAYYSAGYPSRWACQFELTAAFLAGQREGDPTRRLIVVNPEATTEHLYPVELADAKFLLGPPLRDRASTADFVAAVRARVEAVTATFGDVRVNARPRWWAEGPGGSAGFVGRYAEQWELHTALHEGDHPLIRESSSGPTVAVIGLPGSGKSSLVATYAWHFGAAFPGGVFWTSLAGATAADTSGRYGDELRRVARLLRLDLDVERAGRPELIAAVSDRIVTTGRPALWIVDDVPSDLDPAAAAQLILPAGPDLRTVLIGRRDSYRGLTRSVVEVGRMSLDDSRLLLRQYRPPEPGIPETEALDALALRLDGHAFTLRLAGQHLRDRQGLLSYAGYLHRITVEPTTVDSATELLRDLIGELDLGQRLVLQIASVCGRAPIPAQLIARVVAAVRPREPDPGDALVRLRDRLLATRVGDRWQFHSIVLDAARRHLAPILPRSDLARLTADRLVTLARAADARTVADLMPHAAALTHHICPEAPVGEILRLLLAAYYRNRGEPGQAARYADEVVERHPDGVAARLLAAECHCAAGDFEAAIGHARRIRHLAPADDPTVLTADRLLAQALDGLGRFPEAEPYWDRVHMVHPDVAGDPDRTPAGRLAYIRSRRLRGDVATALRHTLALISALESGPDVAADDLQAARIELAQIQVSTNAQAAARRTADAVLRHYHDQGLRGHTQALAAEALLAQAWLTLHLLELGPDPANWREAARSLSDVRQRLRRTYGPLNTQTLTADVEYGYALLCLGLPTRAGHHLTATLARLHQRFDRGHPLTLRTTLLLGRSYAQRHEHDRARDLHEDAYRGLLAGLGPRHPETLHAQYGLGVALVLTGQRRRGGRLLRAVRRMAPSTVGRSADLYAQSVIAVALLALPGWLWRLVDRLSGPTVESGSAGL
jgi:tetratricopeptide (TPR) repeat protein